MKKSYFQALTKPEHVLGAIVLPEGVADGLEPLGWDGDDHVDGGRPDHALGRVEKVRIGQAVPKQKNNRIYLFVTDSRVRREQSTRVSDVRWNSSRQKVTERTFFVSHSDAFDIKY